MRRFVALRSFGDFWPDRITWSRFGSIDRCGELLRVFLARQKRWNVHKVRIAQIHRPVGVTSPHRFDRQVQRLSRKTTIRCEIEVLENVQDQAYRYATRTRWWGAIYVVSVKGGVDGHAGLG